MNIRNEIKTRIVQEGTTMGEVVRTLIAGLHRLEAAKRLGVYPRPLV